MTVSSSTNRVSYNGNSSTTVFAYTFKIFDEDDLTVIVRAANGTETVKTITTHYTVSGVGNSGGGNVTMLTAPATGETLVILREQDLIQELDIVPNDPFPADSVEAALDKLTFMVQQHEETLGRTIRASRTNTITGSEFTISAADRANKVFAFDGSGNVSITQAIGIYRGNWATSTAYSVRDIVKDTSNNNIYIANTSHTSTGAQPISTNADVAKWDLLVDAASATSSASAASASASAAASSASAASGSASAASGSASAASSSASAASSSASAAATSANNAAASFDSFDDRYLGAKTSDPAVDNDGDPLLDGALYFNSTANEMRVYDQGNATWLSVAYNSSNVNIDGGTIDGTTLGGTTAAPATVTTLNSGALAGFRNAIINGNFDVWQRGTSFTANEYGANRWKNNINGSSATQSRQAFTLGQTDVPGEPQYYMRTVVTSVAGASNYATSQHRIEDVRSFAGQTATISFYAKADAAKSIAININQLFGTGGSPSSLVTALAEKKALTTSWQLVTATVAIPSISGKTIGTNNDSSLELQIWYDAGSTFNSLTDSLGQQSGTFEISRVQIELGPVATPFERRPIGVEEALCQRYLRRLEGESGTGYATGQCFSSTVFSVQMKLDPPMRATPTLTSSNVQVWNATGTGQATTDLAVNATSRRSHVRLSGTVASGLVAGDVAYLNGSGTGFIELSAEL